MLPRTDVVFEDRLLIDYRHFDAVSFLSFSSLCISRPSLCQNNITPRFPFGFGLSYTTFQYFGLRIDKIDTTEAEQERNWDVGNTSVTETGSSTAFW
jgi:beta-glucosidase